MTDYPQKDRVMQTARDTMLAELNAMLAEDAGIPLLTEPDAYDLTLAQWVSAFDNKVVNAIVNAPAGSGMDQIITLFTQMNLNRNEFLNKVLTWTQPDKAIGIVAQSLAALKEAKPRPATRTFFTALIKGTPNTIIYASSFIKTVTNQASQDQIYFNTEPSFIGADGTGEMVFYCQNFGEINLQYPTTFEILTSTTGWDSVEIYLNPQNNSTYITIGSEETTDYELMNISNDTVYSRSNHGFNSIIGAIKKQMGVAVKAVNVVINNSPNDKAFPISLNRPTIYSLPSITICIAIVMEDSDTNKQKLGKILLDNITGCDTNYARNTPLANQKSLIYNAGTTASPDNYDFRYIIPNTIFVYFAVNYDITGAIDPNLDKNIRSAIIQLFLHGNNKITAVTMGQYFYQNNFVTAIEPLGLPPYTVSMYFEGDANPRSALCSVIWLQPVTDNAHIIINGKVGVNNE